jgi:DTW domain-containing protein YfiP
MSEKCYRCYRPIKSCYCRYIEPIDTGIKFVFLMHPKEARKQKTGTGRLANLTLKDSEILVGIDFSANPRLQALIKDPAYFPTVMYPGPDAYFSDTPEFRQRLEGKKLLVFLVDSTWGLAGQILNRNPWIKALPKLSFKSEYRSQFEIKQQPAEYCLSTIEAAYYLIKELQVPGIAKPEARAEALMDIFKRMIDYQKDCTLHAPKRQFNVKAEKGE